MSTSFPYLAVAKRYGVPYADVLVFVAKTRLLSDLEFDLMFSTGTSFSAIDDAVHAFRAERARRRNIAEIKERP